MKVEDIESFSLTCRTVHNAGAARIVEHLGRKKKYSVLHIPVKSEVNQQGHDQISSKKRDDHLVIVLCQIFQEPVLAEYVEHLVVDHLNIDFSQNYYVAEAQQPRYELTENKLSILVAIIDSCPYLVDVQEDIRRANNSNKWIRDIEAGGEVALLGLLLFLLCHVQTLCFKTITLESHKLVFHMMSRIAHDPNASALCKLRRLEIGWGCCQKLKHVASAAALPSLESIRLEGLNDTTLRPEIFTQKSSNVKELILGDCEYGMMSPEGFLSIFRALETFIFVPSDRPGELDPRRIITCLLRNAQHSLKHLVLHARCRNRTWMGFLCNFRRLISIHTDWRLLINETGTTSKSQLVETLPSSIQAVHLKVDSTFNTNKTTLDMISHLVAVRRDQFKTLADLKLIHIGTEAASTVLQQPFVKEAENHGFLITCDMSIDPDVARMAEHMARAKILSLAGRLAGLRDWV